MDIAVNRDEVEWFEEAPTYRLRDRITVGYARSPMGRFDVVVALEVHNQPVVYAIDPDRAKALADLLAEWADRVQALREESE